MLFLRVAVRELAEARFPRRDVEIVDDSIGVEVRFQLAIDLKFKHAIVREGLRIGSVPRETYGQGRRIDGIEC